MSLRPWRNPCHAPTKNDCPHQNSTGRVNTNWNQALCRIGGINGRCKPQHHRQMTDHQNDALMMPPTITRRNNCCLVGLPLLLLGIHLLIHLEVLCSRGLAP
jgi:hypothetical protein